VNFGKTAAGRHSWFSWLQTNIAGKRSVWFVFPGSLAIGSTTSIGSVMVPIQPKKGFIDLSFCLLRLILLCAYGMLVPTDLRF